MRFYKLDMHLRDARILLQELREYYAENEELCAQMGQELKVRRKEMQNELNRVRADAIREFAERLKEQSLYANIPMQDALGAWYRQTDVVTVEQIDRIAKEMVGGNDA